MKVLLVQPPHNFNGLSRPPAFFPSGLGYVARQILDAGHQVEVLEAWAKGYDKQQITSQISSLTYDLVGISAHSSQYAYVKWLSAELKKRSSAPIVLGGALATLTPEIVLKHSSVDVCVISEGEETVLELLSKLDSLDKVAGIYYKDSTCRICKTPTRKYINNLDTVSFPAWELFPMDVYLANCIIPGQTHLKALNVIAGRGCPYSCLFCSKTYTGARFRSVDNIIKEIKVLKEKYKIKGIFFADELLLINKKGVYELCDAIEPLNLKWCCQGRVNLVDYDILKRMKKAGCVAVGYGVESGSQTILYNMKKETTVKQGVQAINNTVKLGLRPVVQMMYGYPGETHQTIKETVDFFKNVPYVGYIEFSPTTPLPGTTIWEQAKEKGIIENEEIFLEQLAGGYWSKTDLKPVNLAELSNEEFLPLLRKMEKRIYIHSIIRDPGHFVTNTFWDIIHYLRRFGINTTLMALFDRLLILIRWKRLKSIKVE